jgi:7-cyano-7-deazaguanine synthase
MKRGAVVLFSGGQDSTVCLYYAKEYFGEVYALNIFYGQKHLVECSSAAKITYMANVKLEHVSLPGNTLKGGSIVGIGKAVETDNPEIADSWVPLRNMLFLTIAINRAIVLGFDTVITGVNAIDYSGYPDCRPEFIETCGKAAFIGSEKFVFIDTPLIGLSKADIVKKMFYYDGCPEAMAFSHTCYRGEVPPCGECPACILRAKGFAEAGIKDPLIERLKNA